MKQSRRDVLALGSLALPLLAGCTGLGGGNGSDPTATESSTPTETATETATATETTTGSASVTGLQVAPSIVGLSTVDAVSTVGARDEQFIVASVEGSGVEYDDFSVAAGGETYASVAPYDETGVRSVWVDGGNSYLYESGGDGVVLFTLPKPLDVSAAAIEWPGGERALTDAAVGRLARPPTTFEVQSFTAPETVAVGETVTVEATVKNVGENAGTFIAGLNRNGPRIAYIPVARAAVELEAGETETWTHEYRPTDEDAAGETARFLLRWRDGDRKEATISVEAE